MSKDTQAVMLQKYEMFTIVLAMVLFVIHLKFVLSLVQTGNVWRSNKIKHCPGDHVRSQNIFRLDRALHLPSPLQSVITSLC